MIVFWEYGQKRCVIWRNLNFIKKLKWWINNIFAFLCIFGFLNFWGCFFCGKLTNKNPKNFTKRPPVATTVPSGIQRHHWRIGIPGYTFESSIQARAIPPPSWGSALPVTTGSLYSLQWASPPSTLQKRHLHLLFMIVFWEYGQKRCVIWRKLALWTRSKKVRYLTKVSPLNVELIWHASSIEWAAPVYRFTTSKRLTTLKSRITA